MVTIQSLFEAHLMAVNLERDAFLWRRAGFGACNEDRRTTSGVFLDRGKRPFDAWGVGSRRRATADEAVVIAWMPAVAVYFHDPDENLQEFLAMLPEKPRPDVGVVMWSEWKAISTQG